MSNAKIRKYINGVIDPPHPFDWRKDKTNALKNWFVDSDAAFIYTRMTAEEIKFYEKKGHISKEHPNNTSSLMVVRISKALGRLWMADNKAPAHLMNLLADE
jgi:hypothetical protein